MLEAMLSLETDIYYIQYFRKSVSPTVLFTIPRTINAKIQSVAKTASTPVTAFLFLGPTAKRRLLHYYYENI